MLSIFSSAYWLAVFPHWKNVNSSPLVTFEFLPLLLLRVLYVFNILIPYQIYDLQILSPILWVVIFLVYDFLHCAKLLHLIISRLLISLLIFITVRGG